jgi:cytochrome oxidase Cu insertion factor (SCO1/SenC/PrrC family)
MTDPPDPTEPTEPTEPTSTQHGSLTSEERAAAFSGAASPASRGVDRNAALRAGRTPVSRKMVLSTIAAFAVIGLGGVVLEHFFGNVGVPSSVTTTTLANSGAPSAPGVPTAPQLTAPLDAFIGLKAIGNAAAPSIVLQDQTGTIWSLQDQTGKVVVVTFTNIGCNDICPVLTDELRQARALLGAKAANVEFVVINTDPANTAVVSTPAALTVSGLEGDHSVHFLTGSLRQLNAVWISYGVTVTVGNSPQQMTHNNVLYFVDPQGRLRSEAIPFANENGRGVYVLPQADLARFAGGIAATAASLTPSP